MPQRKAQASANFSSLGYLPKAYPKFLARHSPEFGLLEGRDRFAYATLLWSLAGRPNHNRIEGASTIHCRGHEALFGRGRFREVNDRLGWLVCLEHSHYPTNQAAAWTLSDEARALNALYLEQVHDAIEDSALVKGLVDPTGRPYRIPNDGIRFRDIQGRVCRYPRGTMKAAVEINGDNLHHFHEVAEAYLEGEGCPCAWEWVFEKWEGIRQSKGPNGGQEAADARANLAKNQASIMLDLAKRSGVTGYVLPVTYKESKAGRLYAEGATNLQNCVGEVRRAALAGFYDIDMSNAHWNFIAQLAQNLEQPVPAIDHYIRHKQSVRKEIALEAGVRLDEAKFALLALVYGASLDAAGGDLEERLGPDVMGRLRDCQPIKAIQKDLRKARPLILEHYRNQTAKKAALVNDAGRETGLDESPRHQLAHILQGAEAVALESLMNQLTGNIVVLQHDGLTVVDEPDLAALEQGIEADTGYRIKLEIEPL